MMTDVLRDAQPLAPGFLASRKTSVPKLNAIEKRKLKKKLDTWESKADEDLANGHFGSSR